MYHDLRTHLGAPVALGTTVPGIAATGVVVDGKSASAPVAPTAAPVAPMEAETIARSVPVHAIPEMHLRAMPAARQREHANHLYRSLRHKNIPAVPAADHELLTWILQTQTFHVEPVRMISPSPSVPSVMGISVTAPPGPVVPTISPRPQHINTSASTRNLSPSPWVGAAPCAAPLRSMSPLPKPQVSPLPTPASGFPRAPAASPLPMTSHPVVQNFTPQPGPTRLNIVGAQPQLNLSQSSVPPNLLSQIDRAVEEMERELDMNPDIYNTSRETPRLREGNGINSEQESTVDWLDKQINDIAARRDAFSRRQLNDTLEKSFSDRLLESRLEPRFGHSRLSMLEAEHTMLKRQVSEIELNQEREDVERDRMELERTHLDTLESLEKERYQSTILREQLFETQAACERERHRAEEFALARETADADLKKLEASSRDVLLQCKQLQDKVRSLEASNGDAYQRDIAALEQELGLARGKHQTHETRIRDLEGENSAHVSRVEALLAELTDLRQNGGGNSDAQHSIFRSQIEELESQLEAQARGHEESLQKHHENHRNHVSALEEEVILLREKAAKHGGSTVRLSDLEMEIANARSTEEVLKREKHNHMQRVLELERQVADFMAGDESHKRQHAQNKAKHSELEQLLQELQERHMSEIGHHRSRNNELDRQIEEYLSNERNSQRQHAIHKSKISDLEKEILEHEAEKEALKRHLQSTRQQLKDRETALADAEFEQGSRSQQHNIHLVKIQDLEQRLMDAEAAEAGHKSKHVATASRISELEALLDEHQSAVAKHNNKHETNKSRIRDLEQLLADAEAATSTHRRECQTHKSKVSELQELLEEMKLEDGKHAQRHASNKQLLLQYEDQMKESEGKHQSRHQANSARITELENRLEQQLREAEAAEGNHRSFHQSNAEKIADMERRIAEYELSHAELQNKHDGILGERTELQKRIIELEVAESAIQEVERLRQDLQNATDAKLNAQDELQRMLARMSEVEREKNAEAQKALKLQQELQGLEQDARESAAWQDNRYRTVEAQCKEREARVKQLEERVQELEMSLQQSRSAPNSRVSLRENPPKERQSVTFKDQPKSARMSIFIDQIAERRRLVGELLPGNTDPFVEKVRAALQNATEAHDNSSQTHMTAVEQQLAAMKQARDGGLNYLDALEAYPQREVVVSEQRTALSNVEAASHELKSLIQELEVHHQFSQADHDEIKTRLTIELGKCDAEQDLLMDASSMARLEEHLLQHLLDIYGNGEIDSKRTWDGGMSPIHHAAKAGRRDILQYLLSFEGGRALLYSSDDQGNTPLFYASRHAPIESWLQGYADTSKPIHMHSGDKRPSVSMIPPQYLNLLHQIEKSGWNNVNWKNGFTMLHWAANKGDTHAQLCGYLMTLHGDPNKEDSQGRTPLSLARDAGHREVVAVLEDRLKRQSLRPSPGQSAFASFRVGPSPTFAE